MISKFFRAIADFINPPSQLIQREARFPDKVEPFARQPEAAAQPVAPVSGTIEPVSERSDLTDASVEEIVSEAEQNVWNGIGEDPAAAEDQIPSVGAEADAQDLDTVHTFDLDGVHSEEPESDVVDLFQGDDIAIEDLEAAAAVEGAPVAAPVAEKPKRVRNRSKADPKPLVLTDAFKALLKDAVNAQNVRIASDNTLRFLVADLSTAGLAAIEAAGGKLDVPTKAGKLPVTLDKIPTKAQQKAFEKLARANKGA